MQLLALRNVVAILCALCPVIVIVCFVAYRDRGFDITDESYYLLHAWRPEDYISAVSEFGRYLNFVVSMGGGIVSLRIAGLVSLLLASAFLIFHVVRLASEYFKATLSRAELAVIAGASLLAGLSFYRDWIATPSYNHFSSMGAILVATAGVMALRSRLQEWRVLGPITIGVVLGFGGFVGLIGRPTTALALGAVAIFWFAVVAPLRQLIEIALTAAAVGLTLIVFHVWHFYGSLFELLNRLQFAYELSTTIGTGHTFGASLYLAYWSLFINPGNLLRLPLTCAVLAHGASALLFVRYRKSGTVEFGYGLTAKWRRCSATFGVIGFAALTAVWIWTTPLKLAFNMLGGYGLSIVIYLIFLIVGSMAMRLFMPCRPLPKTGSASSNRNVVILFVLIAGLTTLAHTFGSTTDLVSGSGHTFVLWFVATVMLSFLAAPRGLITHRIALLSIASGVAFYVVSTSLFHPYRLAGTVFQQTEPVTLWFDDSRIRVDQPTANWIVRLQGGAVQGGWQKGLPLIDLTGASPGAALVLAGRPPTAPWLAGSYPGSANYAIKALQKADRLVLESAWILTTTDGPRRIQNDVLLAVGLAFPTRYDRVATFETGYRHERQILWKPKKPGDIMPNDHSGSLVEPSDKDK